MPKRPPPLDLSMLAGEEEEELVRETERKKKNYRRGEGERETKRVRIDEGEEEGSDTEEVKTDEEVDLDREENEGGAISKKVRFAPGTKDYCGCSVTTALVDKITFAFFEEQSIKTVKDVQTLVSAGSLLLETRKEVVRRFKLLAKYGNDFSKKSVPVNTYGSGRGMCIRPIYHGPFIMYLYRLTKGALS